MEHHRLKKYRGPEVWARVKAAYVAGESATSVALRFDVGVANLRKKASREGWTRSAVAARRDRELPPRLLEAEQVRSPGRAAEDRPAPASGEHEAHRCPTALLPHIGVRENVNEALRLAARRIAEGRAQEGEALVRAARALAESTGSQLPTMEQLEGSLVDELEAIARAVEYRAWMVAASLHQLEPEPPVGSEAFYFHLRDRYGRDNDGRDRQWVSENRPDLAGLWDAEGRVPPPPEPEDATVQAIVALLGSGLRLREEGHLSTWVTEAARDAERQASAR